MVIDQQMPAQFTKSFAQRLNDLCWIQVREARGGDSVINGPAPVAPGSLHGC